MIREYKLSFSLSCGHDGFHEMPWHELESKWDWKLFAKEMVGSKLWCDKCIKERKVTGYTFELVGVEYTSAKDYRQNNYPADKWLDTEVVKIKEI